MNILDYVDWRGDLTFKEREFNEVDASILAQFTLLDLDGIVETNDISLEKVGEKYFEEKRHEKSLGLLSPLDVNGLLKKAINSNRFKDIQLHHRINLYDEEKEMQITAFTCDLNRQNRVILFSGTGDTLVAWKEDFNLMVETPTPAQRVAVKYTEEQSRFYYGNLYIVGHSKGGNLTIYAATFVKDDVKRRIVKAYAFDGPGLDEEHAKQMDDTTKKILLSINPEGSIVGRLFLHNEDVAIVKSDREGLYQHDIFYWKVERDQFIRTNKYNQESDIVEKLVKGIMDRMTFQEKVDFSNGLFKLLQGTGSKTLLEVLDNRKKLLDGAEGLSKEEKAILTRVSAELFKNSIVRRSVLTNIIFFRKGQ